MTVCNVHPIPAQVDIVCGTPGRLDDMISTGKLDLSNVGSGDTHTHNTHTHTHTVTNIQLFCILSFIQIHFFVLDEAVSYSVYK